MLRYCREDKLMQKSGQLIKVTKRHWIKERQAETEDEEESQWKVGQVRWNKIKTWFQEVTVQKLHASLCNIKLGSTYTIRLSALESTERGRWHGCVNLFYNRRVFSFARTFYKLTMHYINCTQVLFIFSAPVLLKHVWFIKSACKIGNACAF